MQDDGPRRQLELDRHRAEQDLHDEQAEREVGRPARNVPLPAPCSSSEPPGIRREGRHQDAHERGSQAMSVFDQRGQIERREQPAVAQRPVIPASHPGAGDPNDGAEDDEEISAGGGAPGEPREGAGHGAGNMP